MIFKRAYARLRAQDWTAIAIELLIVVVGVFIGVQASNWNAAREDRGRERLYLQRIDSDLRADIRGYDLRNAFWAQVLDYGNVALAYAQEGKIPAGKTDWDVLLAYFQASQLFEFKTTSATYDELKGAGELRLIRNLKLRDVLANYYTESGNVALSERPAYREHARGYIPIALQQYIWKSCYHSNAQGEQVLIACRPPTSDDQLRRVLEALRADPELTRELRYWMSTMVVARMIGENRQTFARQVRKEIDREIGTRPTRG